MVVRCYAFPRVGTSSHLGSHFGRVRSRRCVKRAAAASESTGYKPLADGSQARSNPPDRKLSNLLLIYVVLRGAEVTSRPAGV